MTVMAMEAEDLEGREPDDESVELPPVTNPRDAEWALRRLRRLVRRKAEHDDAYAVLVRETDEWHASLVASLEAKIEAEERNLANWLSARIAADPRGPKSEALPSGTVRSRAGSLSVEVDDDAAFVEWALKNSPTLVASPPPPPPPPKRPDKKAIKEAATTERRPGDAGPLASVKASGDLEVPGTHLVATELGELLPGVSLVRGERTVTVVWNEAPGG